MGVFVDFQPRLADGVQTIGEPLSVRAFKF
jgi:hypothetical protein